MTFCRPTPRSIAAIPAARLFNLDGEVIGINTAIFSPSGARSASALPFLRHSPDRSIEQLKATGKVERGWIGVRIQPVTDEHRRSGSGSTKPRGALVAGCRSIEPGGQAKCSRETLSSLTTATSIAADVASAGRRDASRHLCQVDDVARRQGGHHRRQDRAAQHRQARLDASRGGNAAQGYADDRRRRHVAGQKITPDVRKALELSEDAKGVIVFDIDEDGPAAKQGVQTGDIIASVGTDPVTTPEQIVDKIDQARKAGRKSLLLRIERDGAAQFVAVPLEAKPSGGG